MAKYGTPKALQLERMIAEAFKRHEQTGLQSSFYSSVATEMIAWRDANAVRDLQERVDELLVANNALVERARDAEARGAVLEAEIAERRRIAKEAVKAIENLNRNYAAECAKDAEDPPDEVYIGRHRFVPEGALDAEKMANAQLFEGLWNIKRAAVDRPEAAALGTLSYIYEVANALAPDAPAKAKGGAA